MGYTATALGRWNNARPSRPRWSQTLTSAVWAACRNVMYLNLAGTGVCDPPPAGRNSRGSGVLTSAGTKVF